MSAMSEVKAMASRLRKEHPGRADEIDDIVALMLDEVDDGASLEHETELALRDLRAIEKREKPGE